MPETQVQYESFPPAPEAQTRFVAGRQKGPALVLALGLAIVFVVLSFVVSFVNNQHMNKVIVKNLDPSGQTTSR